MDVINTINDYQILQFAFAANKLCKYMQYIGNKSSIYVLCMSISHTSD